MSAFDCKIMRASVILSGLLFLVGLLFQIPAQIQLEQGLFSPPYLSYLGYALILMSPVTLLVTALVTFVPSVRARLESCQH